MAPPTARAPGAGRAPFAPLARVERNGAVESWHSGAAAVVTPEGVLVASLGDPATSTFLRSCTKPIQALDLVLAGGVERYSLDPADLALMCASHGGTPEHTRRAESLLVRGGFSKEELQCGAHAPMDEEAAKALAERGEAPSVLHNNCSGKHAGMLLACRLLGWPTESYLDPQHPLQKRILGRVAAFSATAEPEIALATDGCSVPTFSLPLAGTALMFAKLADPAAAGFEDPALESAARTLAGAMTTAPRMVAGPGRFTTRLMEVTGGRVLAKEGAEGLYAVGVRGPVALGAALKVADGGVRCRDGAVIDLLRQLGSLSQEEFENLAAEGFHRPQRRNHRELVVGEIIPDFDLEEVEDAPS